MATSPSRPTAKKRTAPRRAPAKSPRPSAPKRDEPKLDPSDEAAALWELCEEHAGRPLELELTVRRAPLHRPSPQQLARINVAIERGSNSGRYALFLRLASAIPAELRAYFEALAKKSLRARATNKNHVPGALCFFGACVGEWRAFAQWIRDLFGEPSALDAHRRLEVEVLARWLIEARGDEGGLEFLRDELRRWHAQSDGTSGEGSVGSLPFLLRRADPIAVSLLNEVLMLNGYSGVTWSTLSELLSLVLRERLTEGLQDGLRNAAWYGGVGGSDGSRITALRAFAASGASEAALREACGYRPESIAASQECALAAGLIERDPSERAAQVAMDALSGCFDARGRCTPTNFGAAAALVRAMHERGAEGLAPWIDKLRAAAKTCKHPDAELLEWVESAAASIEKG